MSLALAWSVAEACGKPHRSQLFFAIYIGAVVLGATLVLTTPSLVDLAVRVEVVNALLLPLVLGLLVILASRVFKPRVYAKPALAALFTVAFWL